METFGFSITNLKPIQHCCSFLIVFHYQGHPSPTKCLYVPLSTLISGLVLDVALQILQPNILHSLDTNIATFLFVHITFMFKALQPICSNYIHGKIELTFITFARMQKKNLHRINLLRKSNFIVIKTETKLKWIQPCSVVCNTMNIKSWPIFFSYPSSNWLCQCLSAIDFALASLLCHTFYFGLTLCLKIHIGLSFLWYITHYSVSSCAFYIGLSFMSHVHIGLCRAHFTFAQGSPNYGPWARSGQQWNLSDTRTVLEFVC